MDINDIFVIEYLKIINEANDEVKSGNVLLSVTPYTKIKNEVPELGEIVSKFFEEISNKSQLIKDNGKEISFSDMDIAMEKLEDNFMQYVEQAFESIEIDEKLQKQLDQKYGKGDNNGEGEEDKEGKGERKDGEENIEGEAAASEVENADASKAKKTNAKKKAPDAQAAAKKDKRRKCSC